MNFDVIFGKCVTSDCNKLLDFGDDPDHDSDLGILKEFLPLGIRAFVRSVRDLGGCLRSPITSNMSLLRQQRRLCFRSSLQLRVCVCSGQNNSNIVDRFGFKKLG